VASSDSAAGRRRRTLIAISCLAVLVLGGIFFYWHRHGADTAASRPAARAVPVTVTAVARHDVPVSVIGLGTVQATFTVGIHSQVDGKLEQVLFAEGQHVKKGDLLAKIDPRLYQAALDQAKAKRAADQANLVSYEKDMARFKELAQKSFATQQSIDQQQAKVDATKAAILADDAAIEAAQTELDYTNIVAPSDGRMGVRLVDPGNIVHAADQSNIAVLTLTQPAAVLFTLPAQTLDDVRDAMARQTVEVVAYDRDNKRVLSTGTLATIDNVIDQTTATYRLKATFANQDERLWPGEFVNARVALGTLPNALVIPNTAVQRGPDGLFAWVVTAKNTAEARSITAGDSAAGFTVVTAGLADGDRVVTDGQYKLQAGIPVTVIAAPARAPAGPS
jgi:multidrug efflux system membrane fusion protein